MELRIGADPEFFVRRGRHFISGHIFPCGTKQHPLKTEFGHVQVDGIALECNVRPAATRDEFISNVRGVVSDLGGIIRHQHPDNALAIRPSIFFGHKKLTQLPVENAELGCTPDFNAYTCKRNPTPDRRLPIRTGAGHIHIGWTEDADPRQYKFTQVCAKLARQLDYYLGLPSLLWDKDSRRRTLYGQAGAFRPKPYGLEYRVLSNAWVDTDKLIGWVFDRSVAAFKEFAAGNLMEAEFGDLAQKCINSNNIAWPKEYPVVAEMVLK